MRPEDDDEAGPYRVPPGEDRIWLHPSELGALLPPTAEPSEPARSAPVTKRPLAAVPLLSGVIGASLTIGALAFAGVFDRDGAERVIERVASPPRYDLLGEGDGVSGVAAAIAPSLVAVRSMTPSGERIGTGLVFRSDGHLLTNHHLVAGAHQIEVTTADGRTWPARVAGTDESTDLAVLEVDSTSMEAAVLGPAGELRVGQMAVVVGAPTGALGTPSVTAGVIASLGDAVEVNGVLFYNVISTDAVIGSAASGGPLLDRWGTVVGITTAGPQPGVEPLGLVIPIERARRIADQIIVDGRVTHAWLGVECSDLNSGTASEYGTGGGTLVRHVTEGSPAERAGVERQDVITGVGPASISSHAELMTLLARHDPGDRIDLTVVRSGLTQTLKVRLGQEPAR